MSLSHGDIWWAQVAGDKIRPVVILTRARVADRLHSVVVAPVTSTARGIVTEVSLGPDEGVREGSVANLDNTMLLHRSALGRKCGEVGRHRWPEFCQAMAKMMSCA
jgi:mRNA interferase MazF